MSKLITVAVALVAALLLIPGVGAAQSVTVPRLTAPPRLADFASFETSPVAGGMTEVDSLVQRTPVDGAPISERTHVYLGYDAGHFYAVFVCADQPGAVRGHRVNRDRIPDDDDSVALQLDTFRDRRRLYGFQVNPRGVQLDGVYTEGVGWDLSFDAVWTTDTIIRPGGYVVLITIPFSSIRFPKAAEHQWGIFVYRGIPRKNEEAFWPAYSTRYQSRLAYAGDLRGLREIDATRAVQVTPYGTLRGEQTPAPGGTVKDRDVEPRGGVDIKAVVRENLVLDVAANPDFSQVESDEPQTTVNKRFEVFFPERRPFFVENASYFETAIPVLFTRRIQDPRVGARFTGKSGRYAVGALFADDAASAEFASADGSVPRVLSSAFRVSRDLGNESQVGAIYTGRSLGGLDNHVAGVDGRWRLNRNWAGAGQALVSNTAVGSDPSRVGTAFRGSLDGSGRTFTYQLAYSDLSPDFQALSGFIPRTDIRELTQTTNLTFRPARHGVTSWGPGLTLTRVWDHQQNALDGLARFETRIELPKQTRASVFHSIKHERLQLEDVSLDADASLFRQRATGVAFASAPLSGLACSGELSAGTAINLAPAAGNPPVLGDSRTSSLTVALRPAPAFTIDTTYLWTWLGDHRSGEVMLDDQIVRSRWNYQLTRRLSARAIVRYERLHTARRHSALSDRRDVNADLLFTYLVQPGTAVYVGFNSARRRASSSEESDQVFIKVSYLFRL